MQFIILWTDSGSQGKSRCAKVKDTGECKWPSRWYCLRNHPKSSEMYQKTVETCSLVRRVHSSVFPKNKLMSYYMCQDEKDHPDCYQRKPVTMAWGGHCIYVKEPLMWEAYMGILERYMLPPRQQIFPGTPCLFQQDNSRPHSARVTTAWLHRHRVRVLDWPACSSRSVSYWKCMVYHEEENQTTATTDCWAAQVLCTPRLGKNSTSKTAKIEIFNWIEY